MVQRCTNPARPDWRRYGGRGIGVCERWLRFDNFLTDMGLCPEDLTLDRINNDAGYEPNNCRWATWEQQIANRRPSGGELHGSAKLTVDDVIAIRKLASTGMTHRALATKFGVSHTTVGQIVRGQIWRHLLRKPASSERVASFHEGVAI